MQLGFARPYLMHLYARPARSPGLGWWARAGRAMDVGLLAKGEFADQSTRFHPQGGCALAFARVV